MDDLISRSALLKYLRDYKWEFAMGSDFSKAMEMIDAQPKAYDAKKVVAEIQKKYCQRCRNILSVPGAEEYCKEQKCEIEGICEIVRKGGVEC